MSVELVFTSCSYNNVSKNILVHISLHANESTSIGQIPKSGIKIFTVIIKLIDWYVLESCFKIVYFFQSYQ